MRIIRSGQNGTQAGQLNVGSLTQVLDVKEGIAHFIQIGTEPAGQSEWMYSRLGSKKTEDIW